MDEFGDSTTIMKSLKDLHRFIGKAETRHSLKSPRQQLSFSDLSDYQNDSSRESPSFTNSGNLSFMSKRFQKSHSSASLQRNEDSIAGFDVSKRIRDKESDLINAQMNITLLEGQIAKLQTSNEKNTVRYEAEINSLKAERLNDKETIHELMAKIKNLEKKGNELLEEKSEIQMVAERQISKIEAEKKKLQDEHTEHCNQCYERIQLLNKMVSNLHDENKELRNLNLNAKSDQNEELSVSMREKQRECEELQLQLKNIKMQLSSSELKNQDLQRNLDKIEDFKGRYQQYEKNIIEVPKLQKEIAWLKNENHNYKIAAINANLSEEKLNSCKNNCKMIENRYNELKEDNANLIATHEMCERYQEAVQEELGLACMPPIDELKELLSLLKKGDKELCDTIQDLKLSLQSHENTKKEQEETIATLKDELAKSNDVKSKHENMLRRQQRKIMLISKDRDNLKGIISSYESEATLVPSSLEQERLSNLDSQLNSYKNEVERLEKELEKIQGISPSLLLEQGSSSDADKESGADMSKRISELTDRNQQLEDRVEELEMAVECQKVRGAFDPNSTRVLAFQDNPIDRMKQDRKVKLETLEKENEVLKSRIRLLEAGETMDLTFKTGEKVNIDAVYSKEVKELQEKMTALEKQNDRLLGAFKERSVKFREVVYRLTGYRFDLLGENYRIINMYADSEDDVLIFEQKSNGDLQLLETEYSKAISGLVETYLHNQNSYPGFLSALTLELFKARTMVAHSTTSSEQEEENEEDLEEEEDIGMEEEEDEEDLEEEEDEDYERRDEEYDEDEEPPLKRVRQDEDDDDEDDLICLD